MNPINPRKLHNSKWTSTAPRNKEKHFLVTKVKYDDEDGSVVLCQLEAVITKRQEAIDWTTLKNGDEWLIGWK